LVFEDDADVMDSRAGCAIGEDGSDTRIDGDDKWCCRKGVVNCGGDGDAKVTQEAVAEMRVNFHGILIEHEMHFLDGLIRGLPDDGRKRLVGKIVRDF
jgi:hypothetical protein